jgi:hypothetical protein
VLDFLQQRFFFSHRILQFVGVAGQVFRQLTVAIRKREFLYLPCPEHSTTGPGCNHETEQQRSAST